MRTIYFQIDQIPDLSLKKYSALSDEGVDGLLKRQRDFLAQWHGVCRASQSVLHLFILINKERNQGEQLELYLGISGEGTEVDLFPALIACSPLADYYKFRLVSSLPNMSYTRGGTMIKKECLAEVELDRGAQIKKVCYIPHWTISDGARMYDAFRMMGTVARNTPGQEGCAIRLDLFPADEAASSHRALNPVVHELRGDREIRLSQSSLTTSRDDYADSIIKDCESWLTALDTGIHFRTNFYAFAKSDFFVNIILTAAAAEALEEGDYGVYPIRPDDSNGFSLLSRMGNAPREYSRLGKQMAIPSWSTTFSLDEAAAFFRLPALFDGEDIGIPKESTSKAQTGEIYLGKDINSYDVFYSLEELTKHAFFCGTPGSGKTNTMLHLVTEFHRRSIPMLILEPAKKEYRALLNRSEMRDIHLYSPHLQSRFPLRINPLQFPVGVQLSEHISALLEVFEGSFEIPGPVYKFLSSAVQSSYEELGWDIEQINEGNLEYPTLQRIYEKFENELELSSYDGEIKGNIRSFLQVRLGGLMERDAGEMFNVPCSTVAPENWIHISAIVELETIPNQSRNFFILLMCHYISESLKVDPNADPGMEVRHAIFIEEAHNIIAPSADQSGSEVPDPKVSATAYIVRMLAEVRARREAIIIADQLPTALAPEVTKNTALKLVHRLTAKDERATIGSAISASDIQLEQLVAFRHGQALCFHEETLKPFQVQIAKWADYDAEYLSVSDSELGELVACEPWYIEAVRSVAQIILGPARKNAALAAAHAKEWKTQFDLDPKKISDPALLRLEKSWVSHQETAMSVKEQITVKVSMYSKLFTSVWDAVFHPIIQEIDDSLSFCRSVADYKHTHPAIAPVGSILEDLHSFIKREME